MQLITLIERLEEALARKGNVEVFIADPTSRQYSKIDVTYTFDAISPVVIESYIVKGKAK